MVALRLSVVFILIILLTACVKGPDSPQGFSLPPGELNAGEQAFYKYECLACHTLEGYEDSIVAPEIAKKVPLGGKVRGVITYAELVTSIINPSHKLTRRVSKAATSERGMSKMANYNDAMTVTELIDIVTFLQPKYELIPYTPTSYDYH